MPTILTQVSYDGAVVIGARGVSCLNPAHLPAWPTRCCPIEQIHELSSGGRDRPAIENLRRGHFLSVQSLIGILVGFYSGSRQRHAGENSFGS